MPKISAVMALYNTPYSFLQATIESILSQTFVNFELIIIDDASQLRYDKFLEHFRDDRIKYFKLETNAGPGHARNEGIKKAVGQYIAIVDSDDIYLPRRFEAQVSFLDANSDISLLSCAFKHSNNGKISSVIENNEDIKVAMLFNSPLSNPAVMFRKNIFAEKNLFYPENINFAEDYQLWIEAMLAGIKIANINEVLMIYTRRENQLSKTKSGEQITILKGLYKKILEHLKMEISQDEVDLNYNIYLENYNAINIEEVINWFDKIIKHNKLFQLFDEKKLIDKKELILAGINKFQNRFFKIKIGSHNLCIYKPFEISLEKRD